jgi:uroporphyrinogen decarboxylase
VDGKEASVSNLFRQVIDGAVVRVPPIWLMRQAGRYHTPYQRLRARHAFEDLCRQPELSAEVAMGPIDDFDFDAAILFSDLLFPLEALGFGLSYETGPPRLDGRLTHERIAAFRPIDDAIERLRFQHDAMVATRERLPKDKGLIGFVGGPWTLFVYAVEGTHAGPLAVAKASFNLYRAFADRMVPLLVENIALQFAGGADVVMVLDTAAGELDPATFVRHGLGDLAALARAYPGRLGYFAKGVKNSHAARGLDTLAWAGIGLDSSADLRSSLTALGRNGFVQGNFDPDRLTGERRDADSHLRSFLDPIRGLTPDERRGWICGLGHGVLPRTPEANVRLFVDRVREAFT